jgi:hypothetical protein
MVAELEVVARFPDGSIKISNFSELGNPALPKHRRAQNT